MSNCNKVTIDAFKGTTIKSPNFFEIEEITPPEANIADIEAGILTGEYTPINPALYTYEGKVSTDYGQATLHTLDLYIDTVTIDGTVEGGTNTYDVLKFRIPPSVTTTWDNREQTLLFDIRRTEKADTDNVDIWVKGTIDVSPVITE